MRAVLAAAALLAAFVLGPARAQDVVPVPVLTGRVIDQTSTLTAAQADALSAKLATLEKDRGAQVVVLIVPTARPEDIASFAQRVASNWKLGRKEVGDGLLLTVAKNDRDVNIQVAATLQGAIPDVVAGRIIREHILPAFKAGDFAGGLNLAVDRIGGLIAGEQLPAPRRESSRPPTRIGFDWQDMALFLFIGVPILGRILSSVMGRKLGALATGGDEQARGQEPADRTHRSPRAESTELPAHHAAQDATEDRHADEQEDRDVLPVEADPAARSRRLGARRRQLLAGDERAEAIDRDVEAAGEVAGLERGQDVLANDAAGGDVGDRALQRRRHPDVDVAIVLGDRQEQAVADFLPAQLPARRHALRVREDVLGPGRRHYQDHDLRAALPLDRGELGAERVGLRRRERPRLVDDAAGEERHRHEVLRLRGGDGERGEQSRRGKDSAHRALVNQRDAGFSKLTGGGTEICASLATVKLGLVL